MKKAKAIAIMMVFMGCISISGCDTKEASTKEKTNGLLLLLAASQALSQALTQMGGTVTFSDEGRQVVMTSTSGFYLSYPNTANANYSANFENDNNSYIAVSVPPTAAAGSVYHDTTFIGSGTFNGFHFQYQRNGSLYFSGNAFTFTVTSLSGGRINATFSGELLPVAGYSGSATTPITISNGIISAFIRDAY